MNPSAAPTPAPIAVPGPGKMEPMKAPMIKPLAVLTTVAVACPAALLPVQFSEPHWYERPELVAVGEQRPSDVGCWAPAWVGATGGEYGGGDLGFYLLFEECIDQGFPHDAEYL